MNFFEMPNRWFAVWATSCRSDLLKREKISLRQNSLKPLVIGNGDDGFRSSCGEIREWWFLLSGE